MIVRIWGTRGSLPAGTAHTSRFGGNTTCVELHMDDDSRIILDAGTGLYALGEQLSGCQPSPCTLCLSHEHWDHIQGLPYWAQFHDPHWPLTVAMVQREGRADVRALLDSILDERHVPLPQKTLRQNIQLKDLAVGEKFYVGTAHISTCETCHPGGCTAWRVDADGWSCVFTGDHEWGMDTVADARLQTFFSNADVLLADAQYLQEDYEAHRGWGHSCMDSWVEPAAAAGVKALILSHHAPERSDHSLREYADALRARYADLPLQIALASEGMEILYDTEGITVLDNYSISDCPLCDFSREVSSFSDTGTILDSILTEMRRLGRAEAGIIYLVEAGMLVFAGMQNAALFPGAVNTKHNYLTARFPMTTDSIAGYVAVTGTTLNISNVRALPNDTPYTFDPSFDAEMEYATVSLLTVPIKDRRGVVIGVLQAINSVQDGVKNPFTRRMQANIERLGVLGAGYIERGRMMREMILRMLHTSALRDPLETSSHVLRVGAMTAEIYQLWAEKYGVDPIQARRAKANIRIAAMLHDVGKVGIPDAVLKKKGKLTDEEFAIIKSHCTLGAGLFQPVTSELDVMARNIALHHHQKWNGSGYTGDLSVPCLCGEAIPLEARITAVADVYDALVSPRCYKPGWSTEDAMDQIREEAGKHFDPAIVEIFLQMPDIIAAIYQHYPFERTKK